MRMLTLAARILRLGDNTVSSVIQTWVSHLSAFSSCLKIPCILTKMTATAKREVYDATKSMQKELS